MQPIIELHHVSKQFTFRYREDWRVRTYRKHAVRNVSFGVYPGEIVAIVGESGSGKTTLGKMMVNLLQPTSGLILVNGEPTNRLSQRQLQSLRHRIQMVFQNPFATLNPMMTVKEHLEEALQLAGIREPAAKEQETQRLIQLVKLQPQLLNHYPDQLSGGECRRVNLARILARRPQVLILDEPVASLDFAIKQTIVELLLDLHHKLGLTYIWISHDLEIVEYVAHRILVMFDGQVLEEIPRNGSQNDCCAHPYTRVLLTAARHLYSWEEASFCSLGVALPFREPTGLSPSSREQGCSFRPYCQRYRAMGHPGKCRKAEPRFKTVSKNHRVRCHFPWIENSEVTPS